MVVLHSNKGKLLQLILDHLIWYHLFLKLSADVGSLDNDEKNEKIRKTDISDLIFFLEFKGPFSNFDFIFLENKKYLSKIPKVFIFSPKILKKP